MSTSTAPELLERTGYLEARLKACPTLEGIKAQLEEVLISCQDHPGRRLLIDFRPADQVLTTVDRFEIGVIGGRFAPHVERIACIGTINSVDPKKFGARVAQNRGLKVDVFIDLAEALRWLLAGN